MRTSGIKMRIASNEIFFNIGYVEQTMTDV